MILTNNIIHINILVTTYMYRLCVRFKTENFGCLLQAGLELWIIYFPAWEALFIALVRAAGSGIGWRCWIMAESKHSKVKTKLCPTPYIEKEIETERCSSSRRRKLHKLKTSYLLRQPRAVTVSSCSPLGDSPQRRATRQHHKCLQYPLLSTCCSGLKTSLNGLRFSPLSSDISRYRRYKTNL